MTYSGSRFKSVSGTIAGVNDLVSIVAPGSASGVINLKGTFTGTLEVTGAATIDSDSIGGRLIFKSGVGAIGTKTVSITGEHNDEWRIVSGGYGFQVKCIAYTSGSLVMEMSASADASTVFVNGPVSTTEEQAIRGKQGFAASTGAQSVSAGNVMVVTFKNPSSATTNAILRRRLFGNNVGMTDTNLEYQAYGNPTYEPANAPNGLNLRGITPFSVTEFKWETRSSVGLVMGGTLGTGEILPRGAPYARVLDFILEPGAGVGFLITGQGNNLTQAVRMSITLEWIEENIA